MTPAGSVGDGGSILERELIRVRDQLTALTSVVHAIALQHTETKTVMDTLVVTLNEVCDTVQAISTIDRRIWLLERIVFGACAAVLLAFLGALITGTIPTKGL